MRTVSSTDKIVVLKDGVVAEQGSPAQLLHTMKPPSLKICMQFSGDAHFLRQLQQIQLGGPWLLLVPPHFADCVQPDAFPSREKGVVFLSGP